MKSPFTANEVSTRDIILICGTLAVGATTAIAILRKIFRKPKPKENNYPKDTIVVHHTGRGPYAPSFIPFAVKLETYFRMAKIPYQCEFGTASSPKGKFPWVEFNGDILADTSFIIKFMNQHFNINLNDGYSDAEKAAAYAFQKMVEENTYWVGVYDRWVSDTGHRAQIQQEFKLPSLAMYYMKRTFKKYMYGHGIGRHSEDELFEILRDDMTALSKFLGEKKFLLGDKPCLADCSLFGIFSQLYWHSWGSKVEVMLKGFPNLCAYCERIKTTYWPDWDECTTKGKKSTDPPK